MKRRYQKESNNTVSVKKIFSIFIVAAAILLCAGCGKQGMQNTAGESFSFTQDHEDASA